MWSRSAESADVEKEQVIAENPPDGVRTSSPVLCAGAVQADGFWDIYARRRVTMRGPATCWRWDSVLPSTLRIIARRSGEPPMLTYKQAARVVAALADAPIQVPQ